KAAQLLARLDERSIVNDVLVARAADSRGRGGRCQARPADASCTEALGKLHVLGDQCLDLRVVLVGSELGLVLINHQHILHDMSPGCLSLPLDRRLTPGVFDRLWPLFAKTLADHSQATSHLVLDCESVQVEKGRAPRFTHPATDLARRRT